ncbi:MAG: transglutaminase family protein, partial [Gammaproteobacteria bacterium]
MQLRILHRTAYRYDEPVKYSAQALRLTPRREVQQRVLNWSMQAPGRRIEQVDAHGNITHLLTVEDPHKEIEIVVSGAVDVAEEGVLLPHEGQLSPLAYLASTPLTAGDESLTALSRQYLSGSEPMKERLYGLATGVRERVRYTKGATSVEDSASAVLTRGEGVCQDQAHVFISCCRAAGIPLSHLAFCCNIG